MMLSLLCAHRFVRDFAMGTRSSPRSVDHRSSIIPPTRSRVRYLTLESKRIIAIISRAVHTSLPADFENVREFFAMRARKRREFRRGRSNESSTDLERNAARCGEAFKSPINVLTRETAIRRFLTRWCHYDSSEWAIPAKIHCIRSRGEGSGERKRRTVRFEGALHASGYLDYNINNGRFVER